MIFWSYLAATVIAFSIVYRCIPQYGKWICRFLVLYLWFVSAFRQNIGYDYFSYMNQVDLVLSGVVDLSWGFEPTYIFFPIMLNYFNMDYQSFFLVYSTITFAFLYFALHRIFDNDLYVLLGISFYALDVRLMWQSYSIIRQAAAASIIVFALPYAERKQFVKYVLCIFLAAMFHYSAVGMLFLYFMPRKHISTKVYLLLFFAFSIISYMDVFSNFMIYISSLVDIHYFKYLTSDVEMRDIIMGPFTFLLLLLSVLANYYMQDKQYYVNMFLFFNLSWEMLKWCAALARMNFYLEISVIIVMPYLINLLYKKLIRLPREMYLLFFALAFLYSVNANELDVIDRVGDSTGNIDYSMNFNLFK